MTMAASDTARQASAFDSWGGQLFWYGPTHLLMRGFERYDPELRLIITTEHGRDLCAAAGLRYLTPAEFTARLTDKKAPATGIFAFEWNDDLHGFAGAAKVLLPAETVIADAGDKTRLPEILQRAGVDAIPSLLLRAGQDRDPGAVWESFGGFPLVVQQKENSFIGKGTQKAETVELLARLFADLPADDLKITPYLDGDLITSAACVGAGGEVRLSCMSRQIVGLPLLTGHWASHCGNDLAPLPPDLAAKIGGITGGVGRALSEIGFLGIFGMDLIVTVEGRVFPIEINPRMQSVTSLANATEIEAGCVPSAVFHAAAHLGLAWPDASAAPAGTAFSQLCLYNTGAAMTVRQLPGSGVYRVDTTQGLALVDTGRSLVGLGQDECLVTMRASNGETVAPEGRIAYLQFRRELSNSRGAILPEIKAFVLAFRRACGLDAGR